jgi:hypothetical protein
MKVKDETEYLDWKNKNIDGYGSAIFRYAEAWADLMEEKIDTSSPIQNQINSIADQLSRDADTEGITGYMYGIAVSVLAHCWIYGEELRRWHNLDCQIGDEGERANESGGVINPAILHISTK